MDVAKVDLSVAEAVGLLRRRENVAEKIVNKPKGGDILLCHSVTGQHDAYTSYFGFV